MNNIHLIIIIILVIYIISNKNIPLINNNIIKFILLLLIVIINNPPISILITITYIINIIKNKEHFCGCLCGSNMQPQEDKIVIPNNETNRCNIKL